VAKCLLGERSLQFLPLPRSSLRGSEDLYPFAILFRELPVERHEELIRRAPCAGLTRWPTNSRDQSHELTHRLTRPSGVMNLPEALQGRGIVRHFDPYHEGGLIDADRLRWNDRRVGVSAYHCAGAEA
jgi:hypothetical protein